MAAYRLDRFALVSRREGLMLTSGGVPPPSVLTSIQNSLVDSAAVPEAKAKPELTSQQKADAELAKLIEQQNQVQTEAEVAEVVDPGAPKSPVLLYVGIGVGALVLIGGAYFLAKPKKLGRYKSKKARKARRRRR